MILAPATQKTALAIVKTKTEGKLRHGNVEL